MIVEIVGLAEKIDTIFIAKVPIVEMPKLTKTNVERSVVYSVDEVLVTSVNEVLRWIGEKID